MSAASRIPVSPDGGGRDGPPDETTLLDFAAVLLRRWKVWVGTAVVVTVLAAVYAFTQPRVYTAQVVLVPSASAETSSRAQMLAAQFPALMRLGVGGGGGNPGQALVQAILRSASLRDSVLRAVEPTPQGRAAGRRALGEILDDAEVTSDPADRSVSVSITATDPRLAAQLAGRIPDAVNSIAGGLSLEASRRRGETLQRQLEAARSRLAASEERLRDFEQRHGTPALQEQARQTLEVGAELRRQIGEAELRVARLRRSSTSENPQYQAAVAELQGLRGQLARLRAGSGGSDMLVGTGQVPEIKLEMTRLTRQYEADEQVYLALTAEIMSVEANPSDLTVVSVLDAPAVPAEPSGPRVKLLLVLGAMLGGVLGLFLAFTVDYVSRARRSHAHQDFFAEWDRLRGRRVATAAGNGAGSRSGTGAGV